MANDTYDRRDFLGIAGAGAVLGALGACTDGGDSQPGVSVLPRPIRDVPSGVAVQRCRVLLGQLQVRQKRHHPEHWPPGPLLEKRQSWSQQL